jgi:DNA replication initiation complex subunit (GINS family)
MSRFRSWAADQRTLLTALLFVLTAWAITAFGSLAQNATDPANKTGSTTSTTKAKTKPTKKSKATKPRGEKKTAKEQGASPKSNDDRLALH